MNHLQRRNSADGILEEVRIGGCIKLETLTELLQLLTERTNYKHHIAVEIYVGAVLKTVDNEADALETIARLKNASPNPIPGETP